MYGLTMTVSERYSEEEYENVRQNLVKDEITNVEKILQRVPHEGLKVNIKVVSGKSGFELAQFAQRKQADLLVVGSPSTKIFLVRPRIYTRSGVHLRRPAVQFAYRQSTKGGRPWVNWDTPM